MVKAREVGALLALALLAAALPSCGPREEAKTASRAAGSLPAGRGAAGSNHLQTARHYRLLPDGGVIRMEANDPQDRMTQANIQRHLNSTCIMLGAGNLHVPLFAQAATAPGMKTMQKLQRDIHYTFAPLPQGGQIVISSQNPKAVKAIQQLLRFQIQQQHTGDSLSAPKPSPARRRSSKTRKGANT